MTSNDQDKFLELRNKIVELLKEGKKINADATIMAASALNEFYAGYGQSCYVRSVLASKCKDLNFPYNCA